MREGESSKAGCKFKGLRHAASGAIGRGLTRNTHSGLRRQRRPADFRAEKSDFAEPRMNDVTDAGAAFRQRLDGVAADTERAGFMATRA